MRYQSWFVLLCCCVLGLSACPPAPTGTQESAKEAQQEASKEIQQEAAGEPNQEPILSEPSQESQAEMSEEKPTEEGAEQIREERSKVEIVAEGGVIEAEAMIEPSQEAVVEQSNEQGGGTATFAISDPSDVVASYLMSGSSWNYFSGASVPLGRHFGTGNPSYFTAFRFRQVAIPQGATILSAFLSFYPTNEVDSNNRLMINIHAEKTADSAPYDTQNYTQGRPDQRSRTTAKIDRWIVRCNADCSEDINSSKYEFDCPQRKRDCWDRQVAYQVPKDLKDILQEVFSQPTWQAGQAISVFLFNAATEQDGERYKSSRTITGFDAAQQSKAPQLVIEFR